MNVARTLRKPAVPRSKKRRRIRKIKLFFQFLLLLVCLVSGCFFIYWTIQGVGILWHSWGSPVVDAGWTWIKAMPSSERFMWLNRVGWGATGIGFVTSWCLYTRPSPFAKWVTLVCFTYSYFFLCYIAWLVLRSFFDVSRWTENGLIGLAMLGYVWAVGQTRQSRQSS